MGEGAEKINHMSETEIARRECKARSILNKFKDMEKKALNGEDDVGERPSMKRFTPPRKLKGKGVNNNNNESDSEYSDSDSDYSYSYSGSSSGSYTSSGSESEEDEEEIDETLRAMRAAARAKELRAKFEEWENSQDAKDQMRQMMLHDENGESLDTASHLRNKFEAMKMAEEQLNKPSTNRPKFQVKRFK